MTVSREDAARRLAADHRVPAGIYVSDSTGKRFVTVCVDDETAKALGMGDAWGTGCCAIVDTTTWTFVGWDGGEPEDQILCRDWSWVVDALNDLADEAQS